MLKKETNMKEALDKYPEIGSVLGNAGLGCVGCHASTGETIQEGCKAHNFSDKQIDDLMGKINDKIKEFDSLSELDLTEKAVKKLKEKLKKENKKFVRLLPVFQGFDFDATNEKHENELSLNKNVEILISPNLERFLRGVLIDFDDDEKDFSAKRINE